MNQEQIKSKELKTWEAPVLILEDLSNTKDKTPDPDESTSGIGTAS